MGAGPGRRVAGLLRRRFRLRPQPGEDGGVGYLAVTDGFHNTTHKHADELSFELFDHGVPIVNDTGLYHKDPGEIRDFVVSNRAHSGLAVDGLDLPIADGSLAYGSGLTAAGEGDGWYAIEGRNPLFEQQGVAHSRLFLYRPGVALVIVDDLGSDLAHTYTRYLQLHPDVELGDGDEVAIQIGAPGLRRRDLRRARRQPGGAHAGARPGGAAAGHDLAGLPRVVPRWTLAFVDTGSTETRALTIALDGTALRATAPTVDGQTTTVELPTPRATNRRWRSPATAAS